MKLTEVTHKQLEDALDAWNKVRNESSKFNEFDVLRAVAPHLQVASILESGALTDEQWDTILVVLANAIRWSWVPTTTVMHMKAELSRRPAPAPEPDSGCEYCGPVCYGGGEHNARVGSGEKWKPEPQQDDAAVRKESK